ncbi:hypothetical protein [Streptomyces clavifer]|uniref:hypothetical protein n=1 Tax=Streptomyces clavifer TaxID=68188 RepID=UPI0036C6708C
MTRSGPPMVTSVENGVKVTPSAAPVTVTVPVAPSALPSAAVRSKSATEPGWTPWSRQTAVAPVILQSAPVSSATETSAMPAIPPRATV